MIELLVISHVLLLYIAYRLFDRDIISPSFLFISGFTIASYIAYCYRIEWNLGLHANTYFLLTSGSASFLLVEYLYRKKYKATNNKIQQQLPHNKVVNISAYKLLFFALLQTVIYYLHYKHQMAFTNASVWADAISEIDQDNKFGDKSFSLPWYINVPHAFCQCSGYVWICLFTYYISQSLKNYKIIILLGINVALSMGGSFLSGGRMPLLGYLIPFGIMIFAINRFKNRQKKKQKTIKQQLTIIGFALLFAGLFSQIGSLLGRHETDTMDAKYVFAVYCGAQIKNIDTFINSNEPRLINESLPCPSTLRYFYDFFNTRLGTDIDFKKLQTDFKYNGKYFLGNVYTCYSSFYSDVRSGSLLLVGLCSFLACILYRKFNKSIFFATGKIDLKILLYCFFSWGLFLSFFSELFLRRLLSIEYFIRSIIYFYIIIYMLYGKKNKMNR